MRLKNLPHEHISMLASMDNNNDKIKITFVIMIKILVIIIMIIIQMIIIMIYGRKLNMIINNDNNLMQIIII